MIKHLQTELLPQLKEAKELYVAVALINQHGLNVLETIPDDCVRRYLVGTHLPTPPKILQSLLNSENEGSAISTKVHISNSNYHPKVYIIRHKNNRLIAFIGSANATNGGFNNNVEMNIAIEDQKKCEELLKWFEDLFAASQQLDQDFIERYKIKYVRNKQLDSAQKSNNQKFSDQYIEKLDYSLVNGSQFFNQSDFDAFAPSTHRRTEREFINARGRVREKMISLHWTIFRQFTDYGMMNIYPANNRRNFTSQHFHSRGNNHIAKESIWLNYGKRRRDFVWHMRLQVILHHSRDRKFVGVWLFGDRNTSFGDRQRLKEGLNNHIYLDRLWKCLESLGAYYFISVNYEKRDISSFPDRERMIEFLSHDDFSKDFIIGRNYSPNDPDISSENIQETSLIEFSKLYKIYSLMTENVN